MESRFLKEEEITELGIGHGKDIRIARTATISDPREVYIGSHSLISDYTLITGKVFIGNWCHIAHYVHLSGGKVGIDIGNFTGIGSRSTFYTENDSYYGNALWTPAPIHYRKAEVGEIKIGNHVLLGWGCMVYPGVKVPSFTIFGAKSVLKGRYFGEALFMSEGNKVAQFKKDLPDFQRTTDILRKALYDEVGES